MSLRPSSQHRRCQRRGPVGRIGQAGGAHRLAGAVQHLHPAQVLADVLSGPVVRREPVVTEVGVMDDDLAEAAERQIGVRHRLPG